MATTIVNLGRNFNSAVDYLTQGKPHVDDNVIQGKRALDISAINGSANPTYFKKDNDEFLKKNPKVHNKSVKCIKTIIGFDPKYMYYGSLKDRKIAMKVARRVAKRKYPYNSSLIVIQADTPNHILHAHVLTVSREFDTGKSSTHKATFLKTIPYTDEAIHHFHLKTDLKPNPLSRTPKHNTSMSVYKIKQRDHDALWNHYQVRLKRDSPKDHTYSYIDDLHSRIYGCVHISKNLNEFSDNLHKYGVQLKPVFRMRKNKKTGQHQFHYYSHPTNNKS